MTDKNAFNELLGIFENMDTTTLRRPTMPMGVYHQEAADMLEWVMQDKETLVAAGLDWRLVEEFEKRIGASRHAQSKWRALRFTKAEAQRQYAEKSPAAYDLRDTLVHHMLFAYRKLADILLRVRAIAEGTGNADMLQDLSDLAELGRTFATPLNTINFDFTLLDKADETCEELSPLLAVANGESMLDNDTKLNRDRAYTYLKEAVDEIREFGRYVFWRNPVRAKGYASEYQRRHRTAKPINAAPEETAAVG
ncbi:MAG: hypothetical protein JXR76_24690 [Deltaproteobacteria bacterium]|nr:hypothetical protein [Deltaproteobacteria bacterium]